jgi:hypothetical protein
MHPNMPPDLVTAPPADSVEPAGTYAVVRSAPVPLTLDALEGAPSGALMEGCALVIRSETATDRAGRLYLTLTLRGGDGARFEARWWRYPYPPGQRPLVGQVCRFTGTVDPYQGSPQLSVARARPEPDMDVARFAHGTRRSEAELVAELERRIVGLDAELAALVRPVHPRMRGDYASAARQVRPEDGSPPRARGLRLCGCGGCRASYRSFSQGILSTLRV